MSDKRKTLVILTPGFAKNESDTTCLPMQQSLIKNLNKNFPHVHVIILALHYPYLRKHYQWFGNTVISFDGRNRGRLFKLFFWRRLKAELKTIHQDHGIDGILSFWYSECAFIAHRAARKYGIRHYCCSWGQDAKKGNKYAALGFLKNDELVAFSDFLQREYEKNYGIRPTHVIPPGIDKEEFLVQAAEKDIDIIAAGSLIPLKQYDILIHVISELIKSIPGIKAVLIGGGPDKEKLEDMIARLGLVSNITLTGELSHPDVLQWMQRSKVFLHTSSYEGFGVVCIEALCAAAKVISFVKPMNNEIENWHIVKNKEEMIGKTLEILKTPSTEYKSVVPYTIEETAQKIAGLFSF
ncbi:MAG TPA: glycosyltransferase [Chitinophagaceae bacterium]|nr:glycosyltransferase [Chitinophagaceae bacterium]